MVRGEFDRALLAGNESGARDAFEELLRIGRLSSENRLYLEVRLLAGLGLWPQLAGNTKGSVSGDCWRPAPSYM